MNLLYTTFPTEHDAVKVAKALLEERLVACANIFPAHRSLYWWDGAVQDEAEVVVIFKTKEALFAQVEAQIKDLHPYDVPCIIALPIEQGHQPFLDWIAAQTAG